ncbi:MAG: arsenite methyltransferase [Vicinamibacterales bacterium]
MRGSTPDQIRSAVRDAYGAVAAGTQTGCCGGGGCCGPDAESASLGLGYSPTDLASVPDGADLGLGCGNPQAIAALQPGERVLDLGSGAGFDAFLAARQVGPTGSVIGVDMTPQMIARARANAAAVGLPQVEFRLGDIEALPVDDAAVDVVMSNCVINLAPDKAAVFGDAFRVLAPGGRLAIADVVATGDLPAALASDPAAYTGCIAGAATISDLERMLAAAGFEQVRISVRTDSRDLIGQWLPGSGAERVVASALIEAVKPAGAIGAPTACCGSTAQASCCAPAEKPSCCGPAHEAGTCGCTAGR